MLIKLNLRKNIVQRDKLSDCMTHHVTDEISEDELRGKKSELRLYCDLLMQQVHSVKQAINKEDKGSPDQEVCMCKLIPKVLFFPFIYRNMKL